MWTHVLQLLMRYARSYYQIPSSPTVVDVSLRLFQGLCGIQSEPVDAMPEAERSVAAFERHQAVFDDLMARVRRGESLTGLEWLTMVFLASLMGQLEFPRWDDCYVPTFRFYPDMGARVLAIREYLRAAPLADGVARLAAVWHPAESDAVYNAIVSVYVTACNEIGFWGDEDLYARVLNRLSFAEPFLATTVCAYCVKRLVERKAIDIRNMTEEQYDCMKLLDNFYTGPEGAWG